MKYYAPENASFLLPFQFDETLLKADLESCLRFKFLRNYIPENYNGENYILPLRSIEGRIDRPAAAPGIANQYKDTPALEACPYIKQVIETFECEKEAVRLMNLPPGAVVNTHTDFNCGYEDGIFRIHIPVVTNKDVYFRLNDVLLRMNPGEVWYTNVNLPHSVQNKGNTNRVHLVMDCIRNEWSDKLFAAVGFDFHQEKEEVNVLSKETVLRIIEELEDRNAPDTNLFLEQFKIEHGIK